MRVSQLRNSNILYYRPIFSLTHTQEPLERMEIEDIFPLTLAMLLKCFTRALMDNPAGIGTVLIFCFHRIPIEP
jgi:hypothetical protein